MRNYLLLLRVIYSWQRAVFRTFNQATSWLFTASIFTIATRRPGLFSSTEACSSAKTVKYVSFVFLFYAFAA
jgi:hypothetical protein